MQSGVEFKKNKQSDVDVAQPVAKPDKAPIVKFSPRRSAPPEHPHSTKPHLLITKYIMYIIYKYTQLSDKPSEPLGGTLFSSGAVNGPNLDKDSSQIVVCPEREAGVHSCVSVPLLDTFVLATMRKEGDCTVSVHLWVCFILKLKLCQLSCV